MLRDGLPIGVLTLTRSEVKPLTDKQIELVTTYFNSPRTFAPAGTFAPDALLIVAG